MRRNKTLAQIRAGRPVKLAMLGHFIPGFIAHAAHNGYEAIWLDLEHRPMESREIQALLGFFHRYDVDCIIRTPTREKTLLYRYLEDGAAGILVPLIESADEARDIVAKVKFPPLGDRGVEGKGLDGNYGLDTATPDERAVYIKAANRETALIVQLESPQAILQAEAIAAVEGVDILFIGPSDFDIRVRHLPPDQQMTWDEALDRTAKAAQKYGKAWGAMPRNIEHVKDLHQRGATFIPYGIDFNLLIAGLKQSGAQLDEVYGS
jgi:2-keto-3-deoxy-L-rhamnonate aldolase RhmA